jgi:hypothetical protein
MTYSDKWGRPVLNLVSVQMRARFIKPMIMDSVKTVLIGLFILVYTDKKIYY